ncbi:MAG: ABC transporter ATP-binding protein [Hamadaea sp.]|nr:ABC transporter ATP-binding protein [Hamadaea sp.]
MLTVTAARKAFAQIPALDGADLSVADGTLTAVLGPSGCGKTTLLRCIAGFERLDSGVIAVGGQTVADRRTHLPAHRRRIAVVPQEGALFPHLSVADNVAYGLDRAARRSGRVDEVLALVGLAGHGSRMPHQLSGGQQQRVAVARALAPRPPLVLLDEPFSALDAALRAEIRRDIRTALHADGATALLVTHDQGEALSMADQVAVMHAGRIVQHAAPDIVYAEPASAWVATFVGEAILLNATLGDGQAETALGRLPVTGHFANGTATVLLRPEQIQPIGHDGVSAAVIRCDFHGHDALLHLRLDDGTNVVSRVLGAPVPHPGDNIQVAVHGHARVIGG